MPCINLLSNHGGANYNYPLLLTASPEPGAVREEPVKGLPAQGGHSPQLHLLQVSQGVLAKHLGGGKGGRVLCKYLLLVYCAVSVVVIQ